VNYRKDADIVSGLGPADLFTFLGRQRKMDFTAAPLESLPEGTQIIPFFFHNQALDVSTVEFNGKQCVIASLDGNIIFVPLDAYKGAGLPMHDPKPAPEPRPR
jgi:hypothetical protein